MDRDGEIRTLKKWSVSLCIIVFREAMHVSCLLYFVFSVIEEFNQAPVESKGKGLDFKSDMDFGEIVENVNKQLALISLKYFCSNNGLPSSPFISLHRYSVQNSKFHTMFLHTASFYQHIKK